MRRFVVMALLGLLLAACGGDTPANTAGNQDDVATSVAATVAAGQSGPADPTRTPDDTVATVATGGLNSSFEAAAPLDGPVTASVKESTFYYRLDVPVGGVVTSTVSVAASSPGSIQVSLYDSDRNYLSQATVQPGETAALGHVFGAPKGGTAFWSVQGEAEFTLEGSAAAQDDGASGGDAGGEFEQAASAKSGAIKGLLGGSDSADVYLVEVPKGGGRLSFAGQASDEIDFQLFDNDRNYLDQAALTAAEPLTGTRLLNLEQGGKWYVQVRGEGAYDLDLGFAAQDDGGSGKDAPAGGEFDTAAKVSLGAISGELGGDDREDLFAFDLPKDGGTLTLTLSTLKGELQLQTFDSERNYMDDGAANTDAEVTVKRTLAAGGGGRWFARVGGEGPYALKIEFAPQDDAAAAKDAGADFDQAVALKSGNFAGLVGDDDNEDMFRVPAATGRNVRVVVLGAEGSADLQIYDKDRNYGPGGQAYAGADATAAVEGADDYFIRVSGDAAYRVEITP